MEMPETRPVSIRTAEKPDLPALVALENRSFATDRLSQRRFKHWLQADNGILLIAELNGQLAGYGLVLLARGTRLARLYSLAVDSNARGAGLGQQLLTTLEQRAEERGRLFMRLEVAKQNQSAISLYEKLGYRIFGEYTDYYDDHSDALRMQKRIRRMRGGQTFQPVPWYQQTTEFTCGPASLMMAMGSQSLLWQPNQELELDLWREATTIFMTSGHGGCHPLGLALAARRRGFDTEVVLNSQRPLFLEGVRAEKKKQIMTMVDAQFRARACAEGVNVTIRELTEAQLSSWLQRGYGVLVLISTYRLDGRKAPHWVTLTAMDDECLYVHDPDMDTANQVAMDCQHIPISLKDFARMSAFGSERLRTAIAIKWRDDSQPVLAG